MSYLLELKSLKPIYETDGFRIPGILGSISTRHKIRILIFKIFFVSKR